MEESSVIDCPFCGYTTNNEYQIMLHLETLHSEGESPFIVKDDATVGAAMSNLSGPDRENDDDVQYASCPVEGCGETLLLTDFDGHVQLHDLEDPDAEVELAPTAVATAAGASGSLSEDDARGVAFGTKLSVALRNLDDHEPPSSSSAHSEQQEKAKAAWREMMSMPTSSKANLPASSSSKTARRKLGKAELGPYYNEKQMPPWLVKLLETEDGATKFVNRLEGDGRTRKVKVCENQQSDIIPVIKQLLVQDPLTEYAYLCHPSVKHVSKLKKEGGFCGYRNIQMAASYILGVKSQGHEHFNGHMPTIFEIQEWIETAWDLGINASGRIETGGIRGTRKYIGTPEAQAMFVSLGIACDAQAFRTSKTNGLPADVALLRAVETYFSTGRRGRFETVNCTDLPPLYYQQPGHSMTIIGFEQKRDGSKNLLVFDPMFHDASSVTKHIDRTFTHKSPADLLKAYRRGTKYLKKYKEFETLRLTPPQLTVGRGAS
ncbi:peptidase family C78 [Phlyctema vagabunda]|uniref:Peptidase family C78 n=1 Tax=Phlyctema vagabunda TaxID=108571 RepID=A0ABR4PQI1_9HELO